MGAAHSRARPGAGPAKIPHLKTIPTDPESASGYFILCLKTGEKDRIKVVNAPSSVLKTLTGIIKRHCTIIKSGWDRHLAFSYKLQKARGRHSLIQLTAEMLLTLYRSGWEPMTPIDMSLKGLENQTAICFRRNATSESSPYHSPPQSSLSSTNVPTISVSTPSALSSSFEDVVQHQHQFRNRSTNNAQPNRQDCLCLETYGKNSLGFHEVPNTILYDLVQCVQHDWSPGLVGISPAIWSVISDYSVDSDFPVLPVHNSSVGINGRRYLVLKGSPWSQDEEGADLEDAICAENLTISIIACLARHHYKLQISINMDESTRVFFFIKDMGSREVRLPTFCGVGLGEKNGLYVYRPTITRTQTSFFRSR